MPIPVALFPDSRLLTRLLVVALGCYCMGIGASVLMGGVLEPSFRHLGIGFSGEAASDVGWFSEEGALVLLTVGSIFEELVFRTVGFSVLRGEGLSSRAALVLTSMAFGLVHFHGGYVHVIVATVFGLLLGGLYLLQPSFGLIRSAAAHVGINHASYGLVLLYPEATASGSVLLPGWGCALAVMLLTVGLWATVKTSADEPITRAR